MQISGIVLINEEELYNVSFTPLTFQSEASEAEK